MSSPSAAGETGRGRRDLEARGGEVASGVSRPASRPAIKGTNLDDARAGCRPVPCSRWSGRPAPLANGRFLPTVRAAIFDRSDRPQAPRRAASALSAGISRSESLVKSLNWRARQRGKQGMIEGDLHRARRSISAPSSTSQRLHPPARRCWKRGRHGRSRRARYLRRARLLADGERRSRSRTISGGAGRAKGGNSPRRGLLLDRS